MSIHSVVSLTVMLEFIHKSWNQLCTSQWLIEPHRTQSEWRSSIFPKVWKPWKVKQQVGFELFALSSAYLRLVLIKYFSPKLFIKQGMWSLAWVAKEFQKSLFSGGRRSVSTLSKLLRSFTVCFLNDHLHPDWVAPSFQFVEMVKAYVQDRYLGNTCYSDHSSRISDILLLLLLPC